MSATETAGGESAHGIGRTAAKYAAWMKWAGVALILLGLLLFMRALPVERAMEVLKDWIAGQGTAGIVLFGVIYLAAALLFVPAWIFTVAAGAVFGLLRGTIVASLASITCAALAFLISRYLARQRVAARMEDYPKFQAIDEAIGEQGWKIVGLLRLSPAIPFNLQNYLYGVTSIRFWPYLLTSWVAMLPGTFMYVYIGYLGTTALEATSGTGAASTGRWILQIVGFAATVAVTVYITRIARRAIKSKTEIAGGDTNDGDEKPASRPDSKAALASRPARFPWSALALLAAGILVLAGSGMALVWEDAVSRRVANLLHLPASDDAGETDQSNSVRR